MFRQVQLQYVRLFSSLELSEKCPVCSMLRAVPQPRTPRFSVDSDFPLSRFVQLWRVIYTCFPFLRHFSTVRAFVFAVKGLFSASDRSSIPIVARGGQSLRKQGRRSDITSTSRKYVMKCGNPAPKSMTVSIRHCACMSLLYNPTCSSGTLWVIHHLTCSTRRQMSNPSFETSSMKSILALFPIASIDEHR